jgi:hypothetical protein
MEQPKDKDTIKIRIIDKQWKYVATPEKVSNSNELVFDGAVEAERYNINKNHSETVKIFIILANLRDSDELILDRPAKGKRYN